MIESSGSLLAGCMQWNAWRILEEIGTTNKAPSGDLASINGGTS
jgi:hypothetical protein